MSWRVEWLEEAAKDMRRLGKAEQKQVLKGIAKVSENPRPMKGADGTHSDKRAHRMGAGHSRQWNVRPPSFSGP